MSRNSPPHGGHRTLGTVISPYGYAGLAHPTLCLTCHTQGALPRFLTIFHIRKTHFQIMLYSFQLFAITDVGWLRAVHSQHAL
jgi:hypothetical protein